jgi:class 3 adenylate cyclase
LKTSRMQQEDQGRLTELLGKVDQGYQELWGARRALLTERKLTAYLPADQFERLLREPAAEQSLTGRTSDGAVLSVRITQELTAGAEQVPVARVAALNLYFGLIEPLIARWGGIVDRRTGAGVLIVFLLRPNETPLELRRRAIQCGLETLTSLPSHNQRLCAHQLGTLQLRIGVTAGSLILGVLGVETQRTYTVLGEAVELAAQLESHARPAALLAPRELLGQLPDELAKLEALKIVHRRVELSEPRGDVEVVDLVPLLPAHP